MVGQQGQQGAPRFFLGRTHHQLIELWKILGELGKKLEVAAWWVSITESHTYVWKSLGTIIPIDQPPLWLGESGVAACFQRCLWKNLSFSPVPHLSLSGKS